MSKSIKIDVTADLDADAALQEFLDQFNKITKEMEEEREKEAKKLAKENQKKEDMGTIVSSLVQFLDDYYPDSTIVDDIDLSSPDAIDSTVESAISSCETIIYSYEQMKKMAKKSLKMKDFLFF